MSWSGQCADCGRVAMIENAVGISTHSGPAFLRWRKAMVASCGGVLVDERSAEA